MGQALARSFCRLSGKQNTAGHCCIAASKRMMHSLPQLQLASACRFDAGLNVSVSKGPGGFEVSLFSTATFS